MFNIRKRQMNFLENIMSKKAWQKTGLIERKGHKEKI